MSKLLPAALLSIALVLSQTGSPNPAIARSCSGTRCGPKPIQFVPGQRITVQVANRTSGIIQLQKVYGTEPIAIIPGEVSSFVRGGSTDPNFSLVVWDENGQPLRVRIAKPAARTLRVEVRSGGRPPGDRTVYLKDDGRIAVF